jgi:hypothetical protein
MPRAKASSSGRRAIENYVDLGRTSIQSHFRMALDNTPPGMPGPYPALQNFDDSQVWAWIKSWIVATYKTNIESIFVPADRRHSFDPYPATGNQGVYDLSNLLLPAGPVTIGIVGDWGTGTDEAYTVAEKMMIDPKPDLTIHLGDIYYVGEETEVHENCLGKDTQLYKGVRWPVGTKGSFALNGNHEMYSGGNAYFNDFLPTLGIPTSEDKQQLRSYFCLEMPVWRIIAIDTGYNSDTFLGNCKLDDNLIEWLEKVVDPVHKPKPTVLLSHHQWFSDFGDGAYESPANQMAPFLEGKDFVWLWAHEHRLSIYNKFKGNNGLSAFCRCLGHGGMPVAVGDPTDNTHQVEYYDGAESRTGKLDDGTPVGLNGFAQMTVQDSTLTLEYIDINGTSLLTESFAPGGDGHWDDTITRTVVNDPEILVHDIYENG